MSEPELKLGTWKEADAEAGAVEERWFLTCSLWLTQPAFFYSPGPPVRGGTTHSELGPSTPIINQEKVSQACPWAGLPGHSLSSQPLFLDSWIGPS